MALAFKVANSSGSYSSSKHTSSTGTAQRSPQRYYSVMGFWPRYEVTVMWNDETRQVIWGRKALKAWEVAMRMDGYQRYKPRTWKK